MEVGRWRLVVVSPSACREGGNSTRATRRRRPSRQAVPTRHAGLALPRPGIPPADLDGTPNAGTRTANGIRQRLRLSRDDLPTSTRHSPAPASTDRHGFRTSQIFYRNFYPDRPSSLATEHQNPCEQGIRPAIFESAGESFSASHAGSIPASGACGPRWTVSSGPNAVTTTPSTR